METENIQLGDASQAGATSNEVITEPATGTTSEVAQTQPLTQEQVSKMVSDEIAKATETARREIQSIKDKARAEVESQSRKAQLAEATLNQVRGKLKDADPAFAEQLEIEELRTFRTMAQRQAEEATTIQQHQQVIQQFHNNMSQFVTGIGVKPDDSRLDWAEDAANLLDKQTRILASIAKIQQEESQKALEMSSKEFKALEKKLRKDLGLDSVDTSNPTGGASNRDAAARLEERYPTMKRK